MCPKKAKRPDKYNSSGEYTLVIRTGTKPLVTSRNNVAAAKNLLPVLRTFVAPIFPDPDFLISLLLRNLVKINPNGIEPLKYEKTIINIFSINNRIFQKQLYL